MKITIEFDSPDQAVAALRGVGNVQSTGANGSAPLPAPAPYAPPPQAAPQPQYQPPQAANAPPYQPPAAPVHQQPQPVAAANITSAQVAAAAQAYAKVHGPKGAKAKLAEFGITKIIDAQPHQYPDMLRAFAA